MTAILALDLSQNATGWALLRETLVQDRITVGVKSFRLAEGEHPGARTPRVRAWLRSLVTRQAKRVHVVGGMSFEHDEREPRVDIIAWEKIIGGSFGGNARSILYVLEAQVVEVAAEFGIATATVAPSSLKKWATGSGKAKKPAMLAAAHARWPELDIPDHNAADALWVLDWARQGRPL